MNISGIRPYSGFYNVNNVSSVHNNSYDTAPQAVEEKEEKVSAVSQESIEAARSKQTFGSYDYADQYRPTENFEVNSSNSDLRSLDVEKAISDMRKDQAIQQYQFFVGENREAETVSARGSENFSL